MDHMDQMDQMHRCIGETSAPSGKRRGESGLAFLSFTSVSGASRVPVARSASPFIFIHDCHF